MAGMIGSSLDVNVIDKRRTLSQGKADPNTHLTTPLIFTANGVGSTTTLVGANAAPATNTNVARVGEKFRLYATAGSALPVSEQVYTITVIAVAGSTTITFTPAAPGATGAGNVAKLVDSDPLSDEASLDAALTAFDGTRYSAAILRTMNQNDKVWAYRQALDPDGI